MRRVLAVLLIAGLAACQMALPWQKEAADAPAARPVAGGPITGGQITGGPITVTALPATPSGAAAPVVAAPAVPPQAASETPPAPADVPPVAPAVPAVLKTEEQLACERRGGSWSPVGNSLGRTCVYRTRDAGQACRKRSDCEGECLARSRSCAPIRPLFGCNDILQADGRQVTLCID